MQRVSTGLIFSSRLYMRALMNSSACAVSLSDLASRFFSRLLQKKSAAAILKICLCALVLQAHAVVAEENIALNKPAFSSSNETAVLSAGSAFDGNATSRWSSSFADNQWIAVDLGATYLISGIKLQWQNSYGREYLIQTSFDNSNWTTIYSQQNGTGGVEELTLEGEGRYVRMMGLKRFTRYGFSLFEFAVYGDLPQVAANRALNATVTTSSNENATLQGNFAVDGDAKKSRWASSFADNQWIVVDMGTTHRIQKVKLHWQNSYAKEYRIQFSRDGQNWKDAHYQQNGDGGVDEVSINHGGRYLRILCITRFTRYGFSLFEIEAIGYPVASGTLDALYAETSGNSSSSSSSSSSAASQPPVAAEPPPAAPVERSVYDAFEDRIELSWSNVQVPADVAYYQLFRDGVRIADIAATDRSFTDYQVISDQAYQYKLSGCTQSGVCTQLDTLTAKIDSTQQLTLIWSQPDARENGDFLSSDEIGGYEIRLKDLDGKVVRSIVITDPGRNQVNIGQNSGAYLYDIATFDNRGLYSMFVSIEPR
jgi:hypothetical protein